MLDASDLLTRSNVPHPGRTIVACSRYVCTHCSEGNSIYPSCMHKTEVFITPVCFPDTRFIIITCGHHIRASWGKCGSPYNAWMIKSSNLMIARYLPYSRSSIIACRDESTDIWTKGRGIHPSRMRQISSYVSSGCMPDKSNFTTGRREIAVIRAKCNCAHVVYMPETVNLLPAARLPYGRSTIPAGCCSIRRVVIECNSKHH